MRGSGLKKIAFRPNGRGQGRDDFLADGIQRRIRDLGKCLLEVVEQQPRAGRQCCDGAVRPHGSNGLGTAGGHRLQNQPQLLLGVAEGLLTARDRGRGVDDVLPLGQRVQVHQPPMKPLGIGGLGSQPGLDFGVLNDATRSGVHQEHVTGLETALANDRCRIELQDASFGCEDDESVVGHPKSPRTKPIAVQHRPDDRPVGEGHIRGAVPGFHHRGVELIEGPPLRIHVRGVFPRLGDHHEHSVREGASPQVQQLQHLVKGCGVTATRRADRKQPGEVSGDDVRCEHRLSCTHPIAIALDRVDLTVVGNEPVGMREWPRGKGVGGETRMHQGQR